MCRRGGTSSRRHRIRCIQIWIIRSTDARRSNSRAVCATIERGALHFSAKHHGMVSRFQQNSRSFRISRLQQHG